MQILFAQLRTHNYSNYQQGAALATLLSAGAVGYRLPWRALRPC